MTAVTKKLAGPVGRGEVMLSPGFSPIRAATVSLMATES